MKKARQLDKPISWASLFIVVVFSIYFYFLIEWIFFVTKPSFMDTFSLGKKIETLIGAAAVVSIFALIAELPLLLLTFIPGLRRYQPFFIKLGAVLPAIAFGSVLLLWVDNFTYTIFHYGIIKTEGIFRGIYALAFILLSCLIFREIIRTLPKLTSWLNSLSIKVKPLFYSLVIVSFLFPFGLLARQTQIGRSESVLPGINSNTNRPHILWITSDGVNASNMSVYGYERDTTPFLKEMSGSFLVAANAFNNADNTSGSTISMYTGKYPITTRVMYPPNILMGSDAYQHLPGMLRSIGYRSVEIAVPHYVDSYTLNVQDGFDESNGVARGESALISQLNDRFPYNLAYFYYETGNRLADRMRHIFYNKKMAVPIDMVFESSKNFSDRERLNNLFDELESTQQPLFVHVHLMGTHGERFWPEHAVYSAGKTDPAPWDVDYYDDSILDFDYLVRDLYGFLQNKNLLDKTILIVGSDHGQQWSTTDRIPLMFHFPASQYAGVHTENIQNMDVAPTILDYLNIDQPNWMEGNSLLALNEQRPIFSMGTTYSKPGPDGGWVLSEEAFIPPFYQFEFANVISGGKWYRLYLSTGIFETGSIIGYQNAPDEDVSLSKDEAIGMIAGIMERNGFDVSSLRRAAGE